jgi:hypothetical protein
LSARVQHTQAVTARDPEASNSDQPWIMLLLESLSAGVMTILVGSTVLLVIVSLYVIIVWPLTFWDLSNLGWQEYASWVKPILWSVFAVGSLGGYLCFGGAAFKARPKAGFSRSKPAK